MAAVRSGVVLGAVVCALAARASPQPSAPLYLGLALWLAFAAPSLALAFTPGRRSAPAIAALAASFGAALVGRFAGFGNPGYGPDLLIGALGAGMVGFASGVAVFALTSIEPQAAPFADPFVELPIEPPAEA